MRLFDIVNTQAIAEYWTENPNNNAPDKSLLFFPEKKVANTDIEYFLGNKGLIAPLMPSAFDAIPRLRYRQGVQVQNAKMPFFREMMHMTEEEKLELAKLQNKGDIFFQSMLNKIYDDAGELRKAADLVPKIMRYQLLNAIGGTPKVSIGLTTAPGQTDNVIFSQTYDPSGDYATKRFIELVGDAKWDAPTTATPIESLQTIIDGLANEGVDTSSVRLLMNNNTLTLLRKCDEIKAVYVQGTNQNAYVLATNAMVAQVLSAYLGISGIVIEDGTYQGWDGQPHKFYADGYVTIICGNEVLGSTSYGVTAEELDQNAIMDGNVAMVGGKYALCQKVEVGPPVKETIWVAQTVVPTYENMWNTAVVKVK